MLKRLHQVDLRLLRVFGTVVQHGGFAAAQVALDLEQSTVSIHMSNLERRIGLKLCHRGRGGFRLTPDGERVYDAYRRLDRALDTFVSEIESIRGSLVGDIHIAAPSALISGVRSPFCEAIARFQAREGEPHIELHVCPTTEIEVGVCDGRYDLGMSTPPRRAVGLEHIFLYKETQSLYCAKSHPIFKRPDDELSVDEIRKYHGVQHAHSSHLQHPFERSASAIASSSEASVNFILSGQYIGYLPDDFASIWVQRREMRPIKPETFKIELDAGLIVRKNRVAHPVVDAFIEDFRATAAAMN
jgi:DNA-binding transcriptional LysR family regulator